MDFVAQMELACSDTVRRGVNHTGIPSSQIGWGELLALDRFLAERLIVILGFLAKEEGVERIRQGIGSIKSNKRLLEPFLKYFAKDGQVPEVLNALELPVASDIKSNYSPLYTLMLTSMSKEPLRVVYIEAPGGNQWWLPALLDNQVGVTYFDTEGQQRLLSSAVLQQQGVTRSTATQEELVKRLKSVSYEKHTPAEISKVGVYIGKQVLLKRFEKHISERLDSLVRIIPDVSAPVPSVTRPRANNYP